VFRPLALYIGLRYTRAKRRNHFISFISLTSMIGIALGVTVLITVLSVMNGFDQEIRSRIFGMANQVTVSGVERAVSDWKKLERQLIQQPGVTGAAPFVSGQGMLFNQGQQHPVVAIGILPQQEEKVSVIGQKIIAGSYSLKPQHFGVLLGEQLALTLGVNVGDKVNLIIPSVAVTPVAIMPRMKTFTVTGIFRVGRGFGFDSDMAFIHMKDAQLLFQLGESVSGVRLKLKDLYDAPRISEEIAKQLPPSYQVTNWTMDYGPLMHAISLEKTMMFLILLLLIAISAFNLVSSLMMVVTDKRSDIAILRTLGATPRTILFIFMVQGSVIGIVGTLLGLIGGIALASHVTQIVSFIEHTFHVQLLQSNVYFFVNYLPSQIEGEDIWRISLAALGMSLLATIYPAWRAARTEPAEALRYE